MKAFPAILLSLLLIPAMSTEARTKNGWHDISNSMGFCKKIWYGPLARDEILQPHDGQCAFDEASKTLKLDERIFRDVAKPQSTSWEGYFDRNIALKYRFTYFISRSDSYQNNISDYLEDVMDWNGDDCEALRHGITQNIVRLKCMNDKANIVIKAAKTSQRSKLTNTLSLEMEYTPHHLRD